MGSAKNKNSRTDVVYPDSAPLPAGPGRRLPPSRSKLGGAVPVRFEADMIDRIKSISENEGITVSSWIRREISRVLRDLDSNSDESELANVVSIQLYRTRQGEPRQIADSVTADTASTAQYV